MAGCVDDGNQGMAAMKALCAEEIRRACRGRRQGLDGMARISGVSTDTRTLKRGDLYVALCGERVDGHRFVLEACRQGASAAMIEKDVGRRRDLPEDFGLIHVRDTYQALADLARYYRRTLQCTVVAITGSNGKTTTKELVAHLLASRHHVVASPKSFNNRIGVPLTLFLADVNTELVILELGASAPNEIHQLAEIAAPQIGAIVSIGRSHLDGFRHLEGVARAKAELLDALQRGTAVLNVDDPWCRRLRPRVTGRCITVGVREEADLRLTDCTLRAEGMYFRINGHQDAFVPLIGRHFCAAIAVSIAIARRMGMSVDDIIDALGRFRPVPMRMEAVQVRGLSFVNDAYNANPDSLLAACRALSELSCRGRRVLVLGDMLELGEQSVMLHQQTGRQLAGHNLDVIVSLGDGAKDLGLAWKAAEADAGKIHRHVEDSKIAARWIADHVGREDIVLLKGSRQAAVETVLDELARMGRGHGGASP